MVQIGNLKGNSDASMEGAPEPYMKETYSQMLARQKKALAEIAKIASRDVNPEILPLASQPQTAEDEPRTA